MNESLAFFAQHGFSGLVSGVLFLSMGFMLKWVLNFTSQLKEEHLAERREWRESIDEAFERMEKMQAEWRNEIRQIINK